MQSADLAKRAQAVLPGGVNSPVRAFNAVGGEPVFVERAEGAYLYNADGQQYIDYVGGYGPAIVGHAHPRVVAAINAAAERGLCFGASCAAEIALAEQITSLMPHLQQVRLVNSGTEAATTALRIARGATVRDKVIKFVGGYHGHVDSLLVAAGSGAATHGVPSSAGVSPAVVEDTLLAPYNDLAAVEALFAAHPQSIAAIIVEPVAGNMGMVTPVAGFLAGLRELCDHYQSVLIFDEVMTGFRIALGGARELYAVEADLTMLGKVIGGGMPVGAVGGKRELMQQLAPVGEVYQAGTLSGNPLTVAAGQATLKLISEPGFYQGLADKTAKLVAELNAAAQAAGITYHAEAIGGMWGGFFAASVKDFAQAAACDSEVFKVFFHQMLNHGVLLAPSHYEAAFVSAAHSEQDIAQTVVAAEQAFAQLVQ